MHIRGISGTDVLKLCNALDIYPVPCLIISLMEHDNIVRIKEEVPGNGRIASQLSTTITTVDSPLPQVFAFPLIIIFLMSEAKLP